MKPILFVILCFTLTACEKFDDMVKTNVDGYSIRCIEGTRYVLLSSDRGLAITPLVDAEGKPKVCVWEAKK